MNTINPYIKTLFNPVFLDRSDPEFCRTVTVVAMGALVGVAVSFTLGSSLSLTIGAGILTGLLVDRLGKRFTVWIEESAKAHHEKVNQCMDEIENEFLKNSLLNSKGVISAGGTFENPQYSYQFSLEDDVRVEVFTVKEQTIRKESNGSGQIIQLPGRISIYRNGTLFQRSIGTSIPNIQ